MTQETETEDNGRRAPKIGRRTGLALLLGGLGLWMALPHVLPRLLGRGGADLTFTPMHDPVGFRRISTGPPQGGPTPLAGLDLVLSDPVPSPSAATPLSPVDLCRVLFAGGPSPEVVPIAFFTDYNCPYCRVLKNRLEDVQATVGTRVSVTWHEWPILGPTSHVMARAALAAARQGAYAAFHDRVRGGGVVPTPAYLDDVAATIGIDPARMQSDMASAAVTDQLAQVDALARRFGFQGTPGLVVGRTKVTGAVSSGFLTRLVDRERADGPVPGCPV